MMNLLILECIPKYENIQEGKILADVLTLPDDDDDDVMVGVKEFTFKRDLLKYLKRKANLKNYDFIHLSGHGIVEDQETAFFELPHGKVQPYEFPEDCFSDMHMAMSACELGKVGFIDPFIGQTSPLSVLGPQREIPFRDACLFWVNYYSLVLHHGITPRSAYNKTSDFLKGKIIGALKFWETEPEEN